MNKTTQKFLIGASTAAHQVEGNNKNSDFWAMEQMEYSDFAEPSLDAVDHYHRFREDIDLLKQAGLNAYRFSIEWARIEPQKGCFDPGGVEHYREMLLYCRECGIEPVVTMHHFSSPKWLIEQGGWEDERTINAFAEYCAFIAKELGDLMNYVCTINEANMGLALGVIKRSHSAGKNADLQVGIRLEKDGVERREKQKEEYESLFGTAVPQTFLEMRTDAGDRIVARAHQAAARAMKLACPHLKTGLTLSLHDFQAVDGGENNAAAEWEKEFLHYLPYMTDDDFVGVQNYTRKLVGTDGFLPAPTGAKLTQMHYEYYPQALEHVIRKVSKSTDLPILVTEHGVGTADDSDRVAFIEEAMSGIGKCLGDGLKVLGYLHWSLLDNFEWQKGYSQTFGLIAVDRKNQRRTPKESLYCLGSYGKNI
ncbi:MAG: family 1 glycosylhydrolase [Lachnospiraceae bacterium]|nr:family 1 glycosylhydrolase [Lachnospiraceae bacterium]